MSRYVELSRAQADALRAVLGGGAAVYGSAGRVAKNTVESLSRAGLVVLGRRRSPFPGRPGLPAFRLTEAGVRHLLVYSILRSGEKLSAEESAAKWFAYFSKNAVNFGFVEPS